MIQLSHTRTHAHSHLYIYAEGALPHQHIIQTVSNPRQYSIILGFLQPARVRNGLNLATGTQTKGCARDEPCPSSILMLPFPPSPTFQSKHWITAAMVEGTICSVREAPGQILLPLPNGSRRNCCPFTSNPFFILPSSLRNLLGENSSGFSQQFGSQPTH